MIEKDGVVWPDNPHPWSRFLARVFDLLWLSGALQVVARLLGLPLASDFGSSVILWKIVEHIASLPIALALDALIISVAMTTPGKALTGVHVSASDGRKLTVYDYLRRNFSIYVRGFALGIPIISLLAMYLSYSTLERRGVAAWDKSSQTVVTCVGAGAARNWLVLAVALLFSFGFVRLLPDRPA